MVDQGVETGSPQCREQRPGMFAEALESRVQFVASIGFEVRREYGLTRQLLGRSQRLRVVIGMG